MKLKTLDLKMYMKFRMICWKLHLNQCKHFIYIYKDEHVANLIESDEQHRKHLVKINLSNNYPFTSPKAEWDLPVAISNYSTLAKILSQHRSFVIKYQLFFNCMDDLDKHMRILEPDKPKKSDKWRRIALGHHCSLEIQINAESPLEMKPKIRFFGSAKRVKDLQTKWKAFIW